MKSITNKTRLKKVVLVVMIAALLCMAGILIAKNVIIPQRKYDKSVELMENGDYIAAKEMFESLGDYKDSKTQILECTYREAMKLLCNGYDDKAKEIFESLGDYKDSSDHVLEYHYEAAKELMEIGDYLKAEEAFRGLGTYKDSEERVNECIEAYKKEHFDVARSLIESGELFEAYEVLSELDGYEKSDQLYGAIREIVKNTTYDTSFANAFAPISLKNYIGNIQNVHPKVLYISEGFGGHTYWMAYTPYPNSNDEYENPSVAYSDNGYSWTNIDSNPLSDPMGNGYNSDAHLVYREDDGVLECWYRYVSDKNNSPVHEIIKRRTTTDGVTWTDEETIYDNDSGKYAKLLSPSVIYDGAKYNIWVVNADGGGVLDYYNALSSDIGVWTKIRSTKFNIIDDEISVRPWHIDVINDNSTIVVLLMCRNGVSISNNVCSLFITTSTDNTSYTEPIKIVGGSDNWDKYMYRSSIVKVNGMYRIYYSATEGGTSSIYNNAVWGIGITESDELTGGYIGRYLE